MVKIGAVWKGKSKDGKPQLTGTMNGDVRILILPNGRKKEDKHPDYNVYLVENERKGTGDGPKPVAQKSEPEEDF